jgi:NADH dehydrogenase
VIVGAGATGVELAGAIAEIARQTLQTRLPLDPPGRGSHRRAGRRFAGSVDVPRRPRGEGCTPLSELGVQVKTGVTVKEIDREGVTGQGPTATLGCLRAQSSGREA